MGLVEDAQALRAKIDAAQTAARVTIDDQFADLPDDTYDSVLPLFLDGGRARPSDLDGSE